MGTVQAFDFGARAGMHERVDPRLMRQRSRIYPLTGAYFRCATSVTWVNSGMHVGQDGNCLPICNISTT